jgi:hypothetical protein
VAIRPPSDLVLDVAAAADPAKLQAATDKLDKARDAAAERAGEAFQTALAAAAGTGTAAAQAAASGASAASSEAAKLNAVANARTAPMLRQDTSPAKAMEKLEAFFLQSALQEMLPKDAENVYGAGLAGSVWRSMLAEQVAAELAKNTKFGIAERLGQHHFDKKLGRESASLSAANYGAISGTEKNLPFLKDRQPVDIPSLGLSTVGAAKGKRS